MGEAATALGVGRAESAGSWEGPRCFSFVRRWRWPGTQRGLILLICWSRCWRVVELGSAVEDHEASKVVVGSDGAPVDGVGV